MALHKCAKCGYTTQYSGNLTRHAKTCDSQSVPANHRKKIHECKQCDIVFAHKCSLVRHNDKFHCAATGQTPVVIDVAEEIFTAGDGSIARACEVEVIPNDNKPPQSSLVKSLEGITEMRMSDGYVNATKMCQSAGKLWANFAHLDGTKTFLVELSAQLSISQ